MSESFPASDVASLVRTLRTDFVTSFNSKAQLRTLKPTTSLKDSDPSTELQKLSQIIRAHATKIGIIYHPDKFHGSISAACKELQLFTNAVFFLFSLLPLFYTGNYADYFTDALDANILGLLNGVQGLCDEIDALLAGEDTTATTTAESKDSEQDLRLISVGKVWASCDSLKELATLGNLGLLNKKISVSTKLISDTLSELEDWLLEPELESEDPFGLDEYDSGAEDEPEPESASEDSKKTLAEVVEFIKIWQQKLKLIRLLLSSFSKSIASNEYKTKEPLAAQLSKLNELHQLVVEKVDELVSTVFMASHDFKADDEEILELTAVLNSSIQKIVQIIKTLNKGDDKKGKWIEVWDAKYFS